MKVTVIAHRDFTIAPIDGRLYGAFLEQLGRAVYGGIYEPGHPTADADGMRGDVAELVRELDVPVVRYPGGNFASAYNWEDGIGPKEDRPVRLDLAWHSVESNHVGIHEFAAWCETVGTDMMLAVNLGSRGLEEARNFLEYVNHPGGSTWSDLRRRNGREEPWDVKLWCLGNELDAPWQIGHKTADEYGRLAAETGKAMRAFDKSLELVVCGSSNGDMPTHPQWEATVLEHTYEVVDYISLHMYFRNFEKHTGNYLALNAKLDDYIGTIKGVIAYVKAKKRSTRDVYIAFDEWNVWYHSRQRDQKFRDGEMGWLTAPPLLEDVYNFEDLLQVALVLNTFIRRSDVVKIACIAQLVNVIAPIMTETGGGAWRQTIFHPYYLASVFGRGTALDLKVDSPTYDAASHMGVACVDVAGVHNEADGTITLFVVNRSGEAAADMSVSLLAFGPMEIVDHQTITHESLEATNTVDDPDNVAPRPGTGAAIVGGATLNVSLPPYSYHMLRLGPTQG